jgi:hypothetical protein
MKQTAVEWLVSQLNKQGFAQVVTDEEINKAKEMEEYNSKIQAKKYYLKGFEVAELTDNQGCSHEQTMRDAESFFEILYPIK